MSSCVTGLPPWGLGSHMRWNVEGNSRLYGLRPVTYPGIQKSLNVFGMILTQRW